MKEMIRGIAISSIDESVFGDHVLSGIDVGNTDDSAQWSCLLIDGCPLTFFEKLMADGMSVFGGVRQVLPDGLSEVTAIGLHAVTVLPVVDMRGRLDGITVRDKFSGKLVFAAFTDRDPDCTFCRMTYEPRNFTDVIETA